LFNRWWIPAKEVVIFVEKVTLRVVYVTLKHVEDIQDQHLIVQESAVVVVHQVLGPINQAFHLASSRIVSVPYASREQPRIGVHKDLFR
jgi:rRNA processing protein Gar1